MKQPKHQEPMINRKPILPGDIEEDNSDSCLSDKEKFLKKNKDHIVDKEVMKK